MKYECIKGPIMKLGCNLALLSLEQVFLVS